MLSQPIDDILRDARRVLIVGIGGGYDFICGLPLLLELERRGAQVSIANLTFTPLAATRGGTWIAEHLLEVTADATGPDYFPEKWLSAWFRERFQRELPVYCLQACGMIPMMESYRVLAEQLQPDTIIAVDGGVDSLMRGDEHSLGTPMWDALSMGAIEAVSSERRVLATTAFGAERWDDISHADALERIADLSTLR